MGGALARRWQERRICEELVIVEPMSPSRVPAQAGTQSSTWPLPSQGHDACLCYKSFKDIPAGFKPDAVVFAVKPQALPDVIGDYRAFDALIVSIAAGKPISFFEKRLDANARIVRSMPNTPASVGKGITVACANKNVGAREKEMAAALLGAVGDVLWVEKEELLNPVTALSGSGPAYVFLLIETLAKAGVHIGLDPALAEKLARRTVIGSAALAEESADVPASKLRENVTSPGGTTQAALEILMARPGRPGPDVNSGAGTAPGIQELFDRALAAATRRAEELAG